MKYFLIAGEASGDMHASRLMEELKAGDPNAEFRYMGGDRMQQAARGMLFHYRETNYMLLDVLFHLRKILRNMRRIRLSIREWQPDVLIPVDYPGFNMRMARYASRTGIPVYYYISPKVWAWKQGRVRKLRKYCDRLFCILPFEKEFFQRFGMEVEYFGNPLVDQVATFRKDFPGIEAWKDGQALDQRPLVALFAGSRRKEVESMLPMMVRLASEHPEYQYAIAGAPSMEAEIYREHLKGTAIKLIYDQSYPLMASAVAGLVNSGTATLEAALLGLPQVVLYKTGALAYQLGKRILKVNFISLVNLIAGRKVVEELIQGDLLERTRDEFSRLTADEPYREQMRKAYEEIAGQLGDPGVSQRVSKRILECLRE